MVAIPKPVRVEDEPYKAYIREQMCFGIEVFDVELAEEHTKACDRLRPHGQCDPNHIRKGVQTGMRTKPTDFRVLPFCRTLHQEYTDIGHSAFLQKYDLTHEQFEEQIRDWNAIYSRLGTKHVRAKREHSPRVGLTIRHCPSCHGEHRSISLRKVSFRKKDFQFLCIRRNELVTVNL